MSGPLLGAGLGALLGIGLRPRAHLGAALAPGRPRRPPGALPARHPPVPAARRPARPARPARHPRAAAGPGHGRRRPLGGAHLRRPGHGAPPARAVGHRHLGRAVPRRAGGLGRARPRRRGGGGRAHRGDPRARRAADGRGGRHRRAGRRARPRPVPVAAGHPPRGTDDAGVPHRRGAARPQRRCRRGRRRRAGAGGPDLPGRAVRRAAAHAGRRPGRRQPGAGARGPGRADQPAVAGPVRRRRRRGGRARDAAGRGAALAGAGRPRARAATADGERRAQGDRDDGPGRVPRAARSRSCSRSTRASCRWTSSCDPAAADAGRPEQDLWTEGPARPVDR